MAWICACSTPSMSARRIVADLGSNFRYDTEYIGSEWSANDQMHTITFRQPNGNTFTHDANVVISASGPLSTTVLPKLPGLETYKGIQFHALDWDETIDFRHKKVAVIGNGSTGIQIVVSDQIPQRARVQLIRCFTHSQACHSLKALRSHSLYAPGVTLSPRVRHGLCSARLCVSERHLHTVDENYSSFFKSALRCIPGLQTYCREKEFRAVGHRRSRLEPC